eukprot:COSAG01_NODE_781_length_13657_cov_12.763239_11_plen_95_part_01
MVSRVSAFGTWWSMANEWDLEKSKTDADWDQLFQTLQAADAAHDRERSIHNCVRAELLLRATNPPPPPPPPPPPGGRAVLPRRPRVGVGLGWVGG